MAIKHKKGRNKRQFHNRNAVKGGTTRLIKPRISATADEPAGLSGNGLGMLRPDNQGLHLPGALIEASGARHEGSAPGRFMVLIVSVAVIFISIITWFVSDMPER
ncbi:MAG: hypothetical protein L0220_00635 [Acidobacteria bacterium]|nr:hypothetical protein [Acidobacteriota bacterium]